MAGAGQVADGKGALVERIKQAIKAKVRHFCNDEYRQHYRKQSATEAVKAHLKQVAAKAQVGLLLLVMKLRPGDNLQEATVENMEAGLRELTDELAFK